MENGTFNSAGWYSNFSKLISTNPTQIQSSIENFLINVSSSQSYALFESIPLIQKEAKKLIEFNSEAENYSSIFEYRLPYELRRPDVLVLASGEIIVLEMKSKSNYSQADLDQVAAYARDLKSYHKECHDRNVWPVLVPVKSQSLIKNEGDVSIVSPDMLNNIIDNYVKESSSKTLIGDEFIKDEAYCPLPTLVEAARELFESRTIREIWRASSLTDPAVDSVLEIAKKAAKNKTRHLILITGVPGSGKTLVGMRAVHSKVLNEISLRREDSKSTVPGLYLTGNAPLSEVLQYELKKVGGGGATFVRHIKAYLDRYTKNKNVIPPENLLVFDEAQRAFSKEKVKDTHKDWSDEIIKSEPELFIDICNRMPDWSVMIGLIGGGQEIHLGEEEGLQQWVNALDASEKEWEVHSSDQVAEIFKESNLTLNINNDFNLDNELRFHMSKNLHLYIEEILSDDFKKALNYSYEVLSPNNNLSQGLKLYLTRDLDLAKSYLEERYQDDDKARYGILASSRDRDLVNFNINNDWQSTRRIKIGPWFTDSKESPLSCRNFNQTVTEFSCQGLELDMSLLAWGTDLVRNNGKWSIDNSRQYRGGRVEAKNPKQMRINAYRVLLTRGRDGTIIYVPEIKSLNETYEYLSKCGIPELPA